MELRAEKVLIKKISVKLCACGITYITKQGTFVNVKIILDIRTHELALHVGLVLSINYGQQLFRGNNGDCSHTELHATAPWTYMYTQVHGINLRNCINARGQ